VAVNAAVDGTAGNDVLIGTSTGAEVLNGGMGNDILFGNEGNDTLDGGDNNDFLDGGAGQDVIRGGAGDGNKIIISHFKILNKQACNPHGYWSAEHALECFSRGTPLFSLNTQKLAANDNEWSSVA
jgi:hypothetical protein